MIDWLLVVLWIVLRAREMEQSPKSVAQARWRWEKSQERMRGQVIEGEIVWRHIYRRTAHGLRHSVSISGTGGNAVCVRATKWRKAAYHVKKRKRTIAIVLLSMLVMGWLGQTLSFAMLPIPLVAKTWTNTSATGLWSGNGNWNPVNEPAAGDTVTFDATSVDNCSINVNTAALDSFTMAAAYSGRVSLGAQTLNVNFTADGSDFTGIGGTFLAQTGTINVSRHWDTSAATFTFTAWNTANTVNLVGTANLAMRDTTTNAFYSVTLGYTGKTTTMTTDVGVYNLLTIQSGGIFARTAGTVYLWGVISNPPLVNSGTISTVINYGTDGQLIAATTYGSDLYSAPPNAGVQTLNGNIIVNYSFYIRASASGSSTLNTAGYSITTTLYDISIGKAATTQHGILTAGASAISVTRDLLMNTAGSYITGNTSTWTIGRHIDNNSTSASFDLGTSTFIFDSAAAQTVAMNGDSFYDVRFTGVGQKNFTESFGTHDVRATVNVTMQVTAGVTWTVVAGAAVYADAGLLLTLRSSAGGTLWLMTALGSCNATRVDVRDSDARSGNAIWAADGTCVDAGNNFNWDFWGYSELGIIVSGDGLRNFGVVIRG